jgi:hypothetical protein
MPKRGSNKNNKDKKFGFTSLKDDQNKRDTLFWASLNLQLLIKTKKDDQKNDHKRENYKLFLTSREKRITKTNIHPTRANNTVCRIRYFFFLILSVNLIKKEKQPYPSHLYIFSP